MNCNEEKTYSKDKKSVPCYSILFGIQQYQEEADLLLDEISCDFLEHDSVMR